jgi:uncharacterized small protein (DUF1192 family)
MAAQQNNAESISTPNVNKPGVTTKPIGVQSNIAVSKTVNEYFKKFTSLNPSAEPLPQGDGVIRISPFDDYIIFTLYDETSGIRPSNSNSKAIPGISPSADDVINTADTPIDLSNVGTLTLVFVGENDEIRIPNWTQVKDVDLSKGQVLFRISKEDSKKILALDNQNFYISTRMEDPSGVSDESVLYTGTFLGLTDAAQQTLTAKMNDQALLYARELAGLRSVIENYKEQLAEMISLDQDQNSTITALQQSNIELTNEIAILTEELGSTEAELVTKNAQLAAQQAERLKKKRSQIRAISKIAAGSKKGKQIRYNQQAAGLLQEFNTASNPVIIKPSNGNTENTEIDNFLNK